MSASKDYLCIDIGNTAVDISADGKHGKFYLTECDAIEEFLSSFSNKKIAYISSVNRKGLELVKRILELYQIRARILTRHDMECYKASVHLSVENLDVLGVDLFCDIIAVDEYPLLVVDLGTASKILFVDEKRVFKGAMIFPSPLTFPSTLNAKTDLLNDCLISKRLSTVSLITEECISSGVVNGSCALIAGVIDKIKREYNLTRVNIYLTGGNSYVVSDVLPEFTSEKIVKEDDMVLIGVSKLAEYIKEERL